MNQIEKLSFMLGEAVDILVECCDADEEGIWAELEWRWTEEWNERMEMAPSTKPSIAVDAF